MVALYRMLIGNEQMAPFAYGVGCAVYFALSVTLQMRILNLNAVWQRALYMASCAGGIHMSVMLDYAGLADAVMLGILLVTLGYWYCQQWANTGKWYWGAFSIAATTAGVCCYQVHIFLFGMLAVGDAIGRDTTKAGKHRFLYLWKSVSVMVAAAVGYLLLKYLSMRVMLHFGADDNTYSYIHIAHGYQNGLIGWLTSSWQDNVASICRSFAEIAMGRIWGGWLFPVALVPTLALAWQWRRDPIRILLLATLWLLPFVPVVMLGSGVSGKAVFFRLCLHDAVLPAIVWALWLGKAPWARRILPDSLLAGFVVAMVLVASYKVSERAHESRRLYELSVSKVQEIALAARCGQLTQAPDIPIALVGGFSFQGGNTCKTSCATRYSAALATVLGMENMSSQILKQLPDNIRANIEAMPAYPKHGSMRLIDGKIYVRCPIPE